MHRKGSLIANHAVITSAESKEVIKNILENEPLIKIGNKTVKVSSFSVIGKTFQFIMWNGFMECLLNISSLIIAMKIKFRRINTLKKLSHVSYVVFIVRGRPNIKIFRMFGNKLFFHTFNFVHHNNNQHFTDLRTVY